jgi:lysozyme family protein
MLQRALGVPDDGDIGPKTLAALAAADPARLWDLVLAERAMFIAGAIAHQLEDRNGNGIPDGVEYARGWVRRGVADFLRGRAA